MIDVGTDPPAAPASPVRRRRGEVLEKAIYQAVVEQLNAVGYAGMTMEGVAAAARTGKAALYRRWTNKADLVLDALNDVLPSPEDLPDTGRVRDDLLDLLRQKTAVINSPAGTAMQSLLAERDRDRSFVDLVTKRIFAPRQNMLLVVLERAVRRGDLPAGSADPLVAEVGNAMIVQHFLGVDGPIPDSYLVDVVDRIIMPLVQPRPPAAVPVPAG